jgi:UDP-N-acetylmuramoyl-tripeptide--D-alanyl-D-alanine ligase
MPQYTIDSFAAILVAFVGWVLSFSGSLRQSLHILQLEDYEPARMLNVFIKQPGRLQLLGFELIGGIIVITASVLNIFDRTLISFGLILWGFGCFWRYMKIRSSLATQKKKLVMTARARRIYAVSYLLSVLTILCLFNFSVVEFYKPSMYGHYNMSSATYMIIGFIVSMYFIERLSPLWSSLSVLILKPYENATQQKFISDAKRILREINPLVIGITGSYGKTGTKEILSAILAEKYNVFKPPGSYNTLMGVTRIIREELRPYHEIFVAEMGAYRIGSIEKLCNLVTPTHGIITIIGLQHLERFKTQENIKKAKSELVKSLPAGGIAVLNGDDPLCREIGSGFSGKVVYFSVENIVEADRLVLDYDRGNVCPTDIKAVSGVMRPRLTPESIKIENIRIGADGSDFDLVFESTPPPLIPPPQSGRGEIPDVHPSLQSGGELEVTITVPHRSAGGESKGGEREALPAHLSLLGRSAIYNAAAAVAMADQLGVLRESMAKALASIPHVKHRLEPIRHEGGITVLDDAFNSNPIGAKNALEVLATASDGRRILVTPGMVELGSMEEESNFEFGRQAAKACDLAVLVGKQRIEPIKRGLMEAGFNAECIWVVDSLNDGLERLKSYLQPGDTMLLENDLPDQYDKT